MYPNCTYAFYSLIASGRACIRRTIYLYGIILAGVLFTSTTALSQCTPPSMVFKTPTLISGTDGTVGAIYKFKNVTTGVDATIQVLALVGGAGLNQMDNTSQGYYDAWQPYVTAGPNATSYLDWKITFKKANTMIDTLLPCLAITAIDIDGDGSKLREFIVASTPGAYAVDPNTNLDVSFDGVNSRAEGPLSTVPSIDTAEKKYMFQMNFANVSTIIYRNGSISHKGTPDPRHTCIYFKSFFESDLITLPVRLTAFTAKIITEGTALQWTTTNLKDVQNYSVQKSRNGADWSDIGRVNALDGVPHYTYTDHAAGPGRVYYRLQQTDVNDNNAYSRMISVNYAGSGVVTVNMPTVTTKTIPIQLETPAAETYQFAVYNSMGSLMHQRSFATQPGLNPLQLELPATLGAGIYLVAVRDTRGAVISRTRVIIQ